MVQVAKNVFTGEEEYLSFVVCLYNISVDLNHTELFQNRKPT